MIGKKQNRHSKTLAFNEYAVSEEVPMVFIHSLLHPLDFRWRLSKPAN